MASLENLDQESINGIAGLDSEAVEGYDSLQMSSSIDVTPYKTHASRTADSLLFSIPNVAVGGLSVIAESMPGLDAEDIEQWRKAALPAAMEAHFNENQEANELVGSIATMAVPIIKIPQLMKSQTLFKGVEKAIGTKWAKRFTVPDTSITDRVKKITALSNKSVKNQNKTIATESNPLLGKAIRDEYLSAGYDSLKIGLATDATIFGVLNESDFLFPDEMSAAENAAMFLAPTTVIAGISSAFTRLKLKNIANKIHGEGFAKESNPQGVPFTELYSVKGDRDAVTYSHAAMRGRKLQEKELAVGNAELTSNLNAQAGAHAVAIEENVVNMAKDDVFAGLTSSFTMTQPEVNTVLKSLDEDYASVQGVFSIESLKANPADDFAKRKESAMKSIDTKIKNTFEELQDPKLSGKGKEILERKFTQLTEDENTIKNSFGFVLHPDGTRQPMSSYKQTFFDLATGTVRNSLEKNLLKNLDSAADGDVFKVANEGAKKPAFAAKFKQEGATTYAMVSDDLKVILPPEILGAKSILNTKKIVKRIPDEVPENFRKSLLDFGKVYHYKSGQLGSLITESLQRSDRDLLHSWTISAVNHPFRTGANGGDEALERIYKANEGMRQSLRDIAGEDGTIPMLRGESRRSTTDPRNDIVSMTAKPRKAADFGEVTTLSHVDPEDVIAIVGGLGDEFEYIVRGNLKRIVGDEVTERSFQALNFDGKTAVQHLGKLAVDEWNPQTSKQIQMSASMHHTEMDMVLALGAKFGRDNPALLNKIKFGNTIKSFDDIEYTSLAGKYRELVTEVDRMGSQSTGFLKLVESQKTTRADVIRTLNLPHDGVYGIDPVLQVMIDGHAKQFKELGEFIPDLKTFREQVAAMAPSKTALFDDVTDQAVKLHGNQYIPFAEERKALAMFAKNEYQNPLSVDDLINRSMRQRIEIVESLQRGAKLADAPLLEQITAETLRDVDRFDIARQSSMLVEGTQARQGIANAVVQTMDAASNQPIIQAMDSIRGAVDQITQRFIGDMFAKHSSTFNKLLATANEGDLHSFAIARHQLGQGWRGLKLVPTEKGMRLELEKHAFNEDLFKKLYPNEELPDKLYLPNPKAKANSSYEPMSISDLAAKSMSSYNDMSQKALNHINQLRAASKLRPIPRRQFHLPPKNMQGKERVVLLDQYTGKVFSVVTGNTPTQVRKLAEEEISLAKDRGQDLFRATDQDVANYHHMELELLHGAEDYSTSFRQTGGVKGTSFGGVIEIGPEIVQSMNQTLIKQYTQVSRVTSAMLFEPELRAAELASRSSGIIPSTVKKGNDIWTQWKNRAFGLKSQNREQFVGKFYGATEDAYDTILQTVWDAKVAAVRGGQTQAQATRSFEALQKAVPEYNPIKDAEQFISSTMKIKAPHSMVKHMSTINNVTGLAMLRMFEVGLGLVNLGTLPTLVPVVARSLKPIDGKITDEWKAANAAWSSKIDEDTVIWNPYRAATSGMHFMFTPEGRKVMDEAADLGNLKQEIVERMEMITGPSQGYNERLVKNAAKVASTFVDKTEQLSRSISYGVFYNMGAKNLKLGKEAAHEFAHQMANRTIGDFRPNNKPQIFQGAVGAPMGLFTTFAWNYLQRVFGYMEKGDFKTFFHQQGLQAAFFGAKSLPGFNQYVDHFTSNYDGTENMVDRMDRALGTEATDALLFGSVGTLTGLASYTRTDIRLPGSNFAYANNITDLAPATGLVKKTYRGMSEGVKAMMSESGLSKDRAMEIAAQTWPIKSMKGWIELSQGQAVDARGQIINNNMNNALQITSKISGIKTLRDQRVIEEFARQKNQQLKQQEVRNTARLALRSAFRANNLTAESLNGIAEDYLKSGGEPADFANFMNEQAMHGTVDKSFLRALSIANDPSRAGDFMRLIKILSADSPQE